MMMICMHANRDEWGCLRRLVGQCLPLVRGNPKCILCQAYDTTMMVVMMMRRMPHLRLKWTMLTLGNGRPKVYTTKITKDKILAKSWIIFQS